MDESGVGDPEKEPLVAVSGVIVHGDQQLVAVRSALKELAVKHIPPEYRDGFVLHAKEIFNGTSSGFFKRGECPPERWQPIAKGLSDILTDFKLPIAIGYGNKSAWPVSEGFTKLQSQVGAHGTAFLLSSIQIELWMRKHTEDENCLLVVEDNDAARQQIRKIVQDCQDESYETVPELAKVIPFLKINEDPLFQGKKSSSVLQLADFCAYVFRRLLTNPNDPRVTPFFEPWKTQVVFYNLQSIRRALG